MIQAILGKKVGMTEVFDAKGQVIPVTVIEAGPCVVIQQKTKENDGYDAIQLGFDTKKEKNTVKPILSKFKKINSVPRRFVREVEVSGEDMATFTPGKEVMVEEVIKPETFVDVICITKGRGFTGVMKRHGFTGSPGSHGTHEYFRHGGSLGQHSDPSRVYKNVGMAGQYGNSQVTIQNLKVIKVTPEDHCIYIQGAIPGPISGYVIVRQAIKKRNKNISKDTQRKNE